MLKIKEIPYDDVREILASEELRLLNEELCSRLRTNIAPDINPTVMLQSVMTDVCYTTLSAQQFRNLLSEDRRLIVEFAAAMSGKEDLGEEYPPGEEQDEEPLGGECLGICRSAGVGYATELHFARDRTQQELMSYLEMSRTPHRSKYAKQLKAAYQEAIAALALSKKETKA